jgi:general secretion pathway protein G
MKRDKRTGFAPYRRFLPSTGFTLLELLIGISVLVILGAIGFALIKQVSQKTKVVVAKAAITQYVMLLDVVKSDANYYPPAVNGTLESLTYTAAPTGYGRGWRGPYLKTTPIDPWGTPYFYNLLYEEGTIFGPTQCFRSTPPKYQDFSFTASPGSATLVMDNFGVTACSVFLNGTEIIPESAFKKNVLRVEMPITLLTNNVLSVRARSNKSAYILLGITAPLTFGNRTSYIIGSYGSDGKAGGDGFAQDLIWVTGQSGTDF